jgi:segregation and condensation protein B
MTMIDPPTPDLFQPEGTEVPPVSTQTLDHLLEGACHDDGRDLLEALIFSSPDPLNSERLSELLDMPVPAVRDLIGILNSDYTEQGRSFEIQSLAGGWQLVSRRRYAYLIRRLLKARVRPRLSRAALETLSVIAYKQPVTKGEIEALRGVKSDGVVRTLLERQLIKICGRSDAVGRPLLYRSTREFLEIFGLNSVDDLPRLKEMKDLIEGQPEAQLPQDNLVERVPQEMGTETESTAEDVSENPDTGSSLTTHESEGQSQCD